MLSMQFIVTTNRFLSLILQNFVDVSIFVKFQIGPEQNDKTC